MSGRATRWVALLRGINVGRAKRVTMADLRALVEELGYSDVRTLLNSGNVVFTGPAAKPTAVGARIERALLARTGVESRVAVLTAAELAAAIDHNPLGPPADAARFLVGVLVDPADAARLRPLAAERWADDRFAAEGRVAWLWCAAGVLESPLAKAFARVVGAAATTRNWATITKLRALADG